MTYSAEQYLVNQVKYKRPSALLFAENSGTLTYATTPTYINNPSGAPMTILGGGVMIPSNIISRTGTIGTVTNTAGVYTATITGLSSTDGFIINPPALIAAINKTGSLGTGNVTVTAIASSTSIDISSNAVITSGTITNIGNALTTYVPIGYDIYASGDNTDDFLILSDHNRQALDFKQNRLEKRDRMINGRMRSFWTADKLNISTSWQNLPSRSYSGPPLFNQTTGLPTSIVDGNTFFQFTVDGGAGGNELLNWYENHKGSFWVYLSYDKYPNFGSDYAAYQHLNQYNQVIEMFISDFNYSVSKRGGTNYDMWNVSMTLEEA